MIKEKKRYFCSTKVYNNRNCYQTLNDYFVKSPDLPNDQDVSLPIYRAPCTFQSSFVTTIKGKKEVICLVLFLYVMLFC